MNSHKWCVYLLLFFFLTAVPHAILKVQIDIVFHSYDNIIKIKNSYLYFFLKKVFIHVQNYLRGFIQKCECFPLEKKIKTTIFNNTYFSKILHTSGLNFMNNIEYL